MESWCMGVMLGNTHPYFNIDRQNEIIWEGKASKQGIKNIHQSVVKVC